MSGSANTIVTDLRAAGELARSGRVIVGDTETTGLSVADGHRLIEVGFVEMVNLRRTGRELRRVINPGRPIDPESTGVHGFSDADVAGQPSFAEIADEVLAFIGISPVVFHNATFDLDFLDVAFEEAGRPQTFTAIDTVPLSRTLYPGQSAKLDAIARRVGVDISARTNRGLHGALIDARILADVFVAMCDARRGDLFASPADRSGSTSPVAPGGHGARAARSDRRPAQVPALTENEEAAHEGLLKKLDASAGGACLWRGVLSRDNGVR